MDRVLDHQAGDLIVDAQAGARLADVQDARRDGAASGSRSTRPSPARRIGGTLATNASGPQRMLAGTARDLLIGVTVVRADGVVAKAGGRVVKNVAGYDLGKLVVGSFGTLAVITEAVFRLHPEPEVRRWVTVDVDDPDRPRARAGGHPLAGGALGGRGRRRDAVGDARRPARRRRRPRPRRSRTWSAAPVSDTAPDRLGQPTRGAPARSGFKLTFALSGLRDVLAAARDAGVRVRGSAGVGVAYAAADDADRARAGSARSAALHGGTVVVVDAPAEVKRVVDVWGPVPGAGPDAPGQGPVRPRAPALAGPVRGRHLMANPDRRPSWSTTACTAASACRPARPTCCGARRWTRRAAGST